MDRLKLLNRLLGRVGLHLQRTPRRRHMPSRTTGTQPSDLKLYVGCGEDHKPGYVGVDVRPLTTVEIVCKAWELSAHVRNASEIYSRHMLEHLTMAEADAALDDWHRTLKPGGQLTLVVPNLTFHIEQWENAEWTEAALADRRSNARHGSAGLFGWQRHCDPREPGYETSYWDVHKSGYSTTSLAFLLNRAGFADVDVQVEDTLHLMATATR